MCGIVGAVSSSTSGFFTTHSKVFESLLWADTLRGGDSTGAFGVNRYGNVDYLKTRGATDILFRTPEWKEFYDNIYTDFHMLVGHNRKATKGATTDENAHPFVEGNTILVHNGTLFNHSSLTEKKVDVDSHAILHSIVERGAEKTIKELDGAFTLVWYNSDEKELSIIRNEQRPLFIANTPGAWFFASEDKMLEWILDREEIKIEDMTNCKPGTLYTFKLDKKDTMWYRPIELKKPTNIHVIKTSTQQPTPPTTAGDPPEKKDDAPTNGAKYENRDFPIGTKILVCVKEVKELSKERNGNTHIIVGHWFHDMSVLVRCFTTESEIKKIDAALDDEQSIDLAIFQCTINLVITNASKGTVTLHCDNAIPTGTKYDMEGREIWEDQFMFTDKTCSYCGSHTTFDSLQKGIFKFTDSEDNEIMCEHCYDKGLYLE